MAGVTGTAGTPPSPARRVVGWPAVRLALAVILAYLYGWALGRTPSPTDASEFWIGNLAAPYAIIGFLAGAWALRRPWTAAVAGAVSAMAAVAGFYNFFAIGNATATDLGMAPTASATSVVLRAYGRWFANMLWGDPGGTPWLTIALVFGLLFGVLGQRWRVRRARAGTALLGIVLVAEPLVYASRANTVVIGAAYAASAHNLVIWGIEFAVGIVVLVSAARQRRPAPARTDAPRSDSEPRTEPVG